MHFCNHQPATHVLELIAQIMSEPHASDGLLQRGYRYALSLSHDRSTAEDLVGDACARIVCASAPWKAAYMFRVIRNLWFDRVRQQGRVALERVEGEIVGPEPTLSGFDDSLEAALASLTPDAREMLFLWAVEGYTVAEIGETVGKSRGTVLSSLHRAKGKLRERLSWDERKVL